MDVQSLPIAREAKIICHPQIRGGQPVIAGTSIPVWIIVAYSNRGQYREELLADFPHLTLADIDAALTYYRDHEAEIERALAENGELTG